MTGRTDHSASPEARSLWRRLGWPTAVSAAASIALGLGVLVGALGAGVAPPRAAVLASLSVTLWIGLAAAPLAAGADDWLAALGRAGVLADASVVTLLAAGIWGGGAIGWAEGAGIYLLWAALAVTGYLATRLGRRALTRGGLAVAAAVGMMLAMSSLFWSDGLLTSRVGAARDTVARRLLWPNALYGVADLAGRKHEFVWTSQAQMYRFTPIGQDIVPPAFGWWMPAVFWWGVAALLAALWAARRAVAGAAVSGRPLRQCVPGDERTP